MFISNWLHKTAVKGLLIGVCFLSPTALNAKDEAKEPAPTVEQSEGATIEAPAPDNKTTKETTERKTAPAETLPTSPVQSERPPEPSSNTKDQAAQQREKADLKAQESMAISAFELTAIVYK